MKYSIVLSIFLLVFFISCNNKPKDTPTVTESPVKDYSDWYQVETGKPSALVFASYKTTMLANGKDQSLLRISTVDSLGMELKDASLPFEISVKGDATIIDIDSTELAPVLKSDTLTVWKSNISNGVKKLWLRAGNTTDKITVKVSTDSLWPASHEIHTIPADVKLLRPTKEQITQGPKTDKKRQASSLL